jgi:hypothetical protein
MGKHANETPEAPRSRVPRLPVEVEAVIVKAMEKKPASRFADMRAFREALAAASDRSRAKDIGRKVVVGVVTAGAVCLLVAAGYKQWAIDHQAKTAALASEASPQEWATRRAPLGGGEEAIPLPGSVSDMKPEQPVLDPAHDPPLEPSPELSAKDRAPAETDIEPLPAPVGQEVATQTTPAPAAMSHPPVRAPGAHAVHRVSQRQLVTTELDDARERAEQNAADRDALRAWALAAFDAREYQEAERACVAWAARDRGVDPTLWRARALDARGRRSDARHLMEECVRAHPDSVEARRLLLKLAPRKRH